MKNERVGMKVVFVVLHKAETDAELRSPEGLLNVRSAEVANIPSQGDTFSPVDDCGKHQRFKCLRVDRNQQGVLVDGHDAVIYAEFIETLTP
jgi:hypothetical protein